MTEAAKTAISDQIEELRERVEKGINWLTEHDPDGSFHVWFSAGLTGLSPMPAQQDHRREAWREYHRQRERWERMSRDLERVDPTWRPVR